MADFKSLPGAKRGTRLAAISIAVPFCGFRTRREFNRFWTRLEVEADARKRVAHLVLRHRGELLPIGEELPAHERAAIARDLRRALAGNAEAGNAR